MKYLIAITIMLILTGCIYPVHRTVQPATTVKVVDKENRAIAEANVNLITHESPPSVVTVKKRKTDALGMVKFESIKKWGTDMLVMHGQKLPNSWTLCVKKNNYTTQYIYMNQDNPQHKKVTLLQGDSTECSDNYDRGIQRTYRQKYWFAILAVDEENARNVDKMSKQDADDLGDIILTDWRDISKKYLIKNSLVVEHSMVAKAESVRDKFTNGYLIRIALTKKGAEALSNFTAHNVGKRVAFVLNDKVYSAPIIAQQISGGEVVIRGDFSKKEAFDIVNDLNLDRKEKRL